MSSTHFIEKPNLHYTRGIMPKHVASDGAFVRSLASGQHSLEETSQRWWVVGDSVSDLSDPGIEP